MTRTLVMKTMCPLLMGPPLMDPTLMAQSLRIQAAVTVYTVLQRVRRSTVMVRSLWEETA